VLDDLNHVYPGLLQGEKSLQTEALRFVKVFDRITLMEISLNEYILDMIIHYPKILLEPLLYNE
jgi:hypothetical protein